jgi:hypothetical protein
MPNLDNDCADQLTKLEVRVVLRADGDGVRLTMQVGPDRLELSTFFIHSDLIAVEAELPKTYAATQYISQTLGEQSPMGDVRFETLEGKLRVSLQKDGERKVTFALGVVKPVHVAIKDAQGELGPDIQVAATNPLVALTADGMMQTATLKVDVGAVNVLADWDPMGGAAPNRDLHVAVGGLTGSTTFTEANDEIVAKGVGVGPTSVKVRGASLFDVGLNPSDMHRFDVRVSLDQAGEPKLEITPRFDLSVGLHFNVVSADYARDGQPPAWALDETYAIKLENGGMTATVASAPATDTFTGGVKVGPGTLTLSSDKVAAPLVVPAGKCLVHNPTPAAGAHPLLGTLMTADCP